MKERRSLVEGLTVSAELKEAEAAFVFGSKSKSISEPASDPTPTPEEFPSEIEELEKVSTGVLPFMKGRIPVTTRCRPEIASALKRTSLKRQLAGIEPYYVQDILEAAIEEWLKKNGVVV